jgi:hypothetical protein
MERAKMKVIAWFLALFLLPVVGLVPQRWLPIASAACSGSIVKDAVGGNENTSNHRGTKANILVNDFSSHQYQTWRQVAVVENSNNFAEAGWSWIEGYGQYAFPMKIWVDNGVKSWVYFNQISLARGFRHEFKVHDSDGNWYWSFAYNGNEMGNEFVSFSNGTSLSESERWCTSDVLFAEFRELQKCQGQGCGWTDYGGLSQYINTTTDYRFCWKSKTAYDVRGQC